jgi:hypothetical protein
VRELLQPFAASFDYDGGARTTVDRDCDSTRGREDVGQRIESRATSALRAEVYERMTRSAVEVFAVFMMFALSVILHFVWMQAFLNGGRVTIAIDMYGEMWVEYALWVVVAAVVSVGFAQYLDRGSGQ